MSLFSDQPLPPREDRVSVRILHRWWTLGLWLVYVADSDDSMFGFARLGVTRSYKTALDLALRWLEALVRRKNYRAGTNSG